MFTAMPLSYCMCVPLISLKKDQVSNQNFCDISASYIGDCSEQHLLDILLVTVTNIFFYVLQ